MRPEKDHDSGLGEKLLNKYNRWCCALLASASALPPDPTGVSRLVIQSSFLETDEMLKHGEELKGEGVRIALTSGLQRERVADSGAASLP